MDIFVVKITCFFYWKILTFWHKLMTSWNWTGVAAALSRWSTAYILHSLVNQNQQHLISFNAVEDLEVQKSSQWHQQIQHPPLKQRWDPDARTRTSSCGCTWRFDHSLFFLLQPVTDDIVFVVLVCQGNPDLHLPAVLTPYQCLPLLLGFWLWRTGVYQVGLRWKRKCVSSSPFTSRFRCFLQRM